VDDLTIRQATRAPQGTLTVLASSDAPRIRTEVLHFHTTAGAEFWDLTELVRGVVGRSGVRHGQVTIHTPHTTTSVMLNESATTEIYTENLQEDEFLNGHAHCRQMLTGSSSVTVPVVDGEVLLGTWQKVLFAEFDQARERRVVVHAQGA
jgi:secondary thiamine-phosphate synthase enzyme